MGKLKASAELAHALHALALIKRICHNVTPGGPVDDLAQCANVADQGMTGEKLEGDPGIYDLSEIRSV